MEKDIIKDLVLPVPIPFVSDLYVRLYDDFLNEYMFSFNFLYFIYLKSVWRGRLALQFIVWL